MGEERESDETSMNPLRNTSRFAAVAIRWFSVCAYAAVGAFVAVLVKPELSQLGASIVSRLGTPESPALSGVVLLAWIGLLVHVHLSESIGWLSLRYVPWYPSIGTSVLLGCIMAVLVDCGTRRNMLAVWTDSGWRLGSLAIVAFLLPSVVATVRTLHRSSMRDKSRSMKFMSLLESSEKLCAWASVEQPITHPSEDLLGHDKIAMRLAKRLHESEKMGRIATIGILGRHGSGKSSILTLTDYHLRNTAAVRNNRIRMVRVNTWGFTSPESGIRFVVQQLIGALSKEINCFSVSGVPDEFVEAIASSVPRGGAFAKLIPVSIDPNDALRRISHVLDSIRLTIVLCIEDIDRNPESSFNERHCEALLDRIRNYSRIGYILTVAPRQGDSTFDFARLCEYEETVPELEPEAVKRIISAATRHAWVKYNAIDPVALRHGTLPTDCSTTTIEFDNELFRSESGESRIVRVEEALVAVLGCPRGLRATLHKAFSTWQAMPGEVSFQNVVIASTIRAEWPHVWRFLRNNERELIDQPMTNVLKANGSANAQLGLACKADGVDLGVATLFLKTLFTRRGLQSMSCHKGVYWRRFIAGELACDEIPDQAVLQAIKDYHENADPTLVHMCAADARFRSTFVHFSTCLPADEVLPLLSKIMLAAEEKSLGRGIPDRDIAACAMEILRSGRVPRGEIQKWVVAEFKRTAPQCLDHATNILFYCSSSTVLQPEERKAVRAEVVEYIKSTFGENPAAMERATLHSSPFLFNWLLLGTSSRDGLPQTSPDEWIGFGDAIVKAIEINSTHLSESLIGLLAGRLPACMDGENGLTYRLDWDVVRHMFRDKGKLTSVTRSFDVTKIGDGTLRLFAEKFRSIDFRDPNSDPSYQPGLCKEAG